MTAKEALKERIDNLSEEEAAALLDLIEIQEEDTFIIEPPDLARWERFQEELRAEGPVMTEEAWNEFARSLDAERPHRPLFEEYYLTRPGR